MQNGVHEYIRSGLKSGNVWLPFAIESSVFQFAIYNCKVQNEPNYNFAWFQWARNFVFHFEGRREIVWVLKRVLKKLFGYNMGEVTGEWRRLHNEELYDLYCSVNISRVIR